MNHKRLWILAALLVLLVFPASASMVSFLLVETGLNEDAPGVQYTSLWEGGLMAAFFDAGHIVTNSPIARMEKKPPADLSGQAASDIDEAALGGAEYFVLGFLEYQFNGVTPVPVGMALKIYEAGSRRLIYEQRFTAGSGKNLNEEYQFAQNAGRILISHIKDR